MSASGIAAVARVRTALQTGAALGLLLVVVAACAPAPGQEVVETTTASPETGQPVKELPLQSGYYVAADVPCDRASNATLLLLRPNGIGGARDFCEFQTIRQLSDVLYRVEETCAAFQDDFSETRQTHYLVRGNTHFVATSQSGDVYEGRHCPQSDLPAEWQDTDIESVID